MSQSKYWIWLAAQPSVSMRTKYRLLDTFSSPEEIFHAPVSQLRLRCGLTPAEEQVLKGRTLDAAEDILRRCREQGLSVLTVQDSSYPRRLHCTANPPMVLYVRGRLPDMDDEAAVAVIGTRGASPYGLDCAESMGREIVRHGGVLLTGLTRGIEAAAAEGALAEGGTVVAVLGTAHERETGRLAQKVAETGAVISEYAPGTAPLKAYFRERNRITSGLCVGTVVVEAPENSGARGFVEEALRQGRDVFAVPGGINSPNSALCNSLIREGATLAVNGWDVMSEYERQFPQKVRHAEERQIAPEPMKAAEAPEKLEKSEKPQPPSPKKPEPETLEKQLEGLSEIQLRIIGAMGRGAEHIDDIVERTSLPAGAVLSQLTVLEIKGYIRRENGRKYALNVVKK